MFLREEIDLELIEKIKKMAEEQADKLKLTVYNVYFENSGKEKVLHIEVDKKSGITLKDVSEFTELINPELDTLPEIDFSYSLDCSSLGAERFIKPEEIGRHINEYMEVSTKDRKVLGTFIEDTDDSVIIKSFIKGRPHKDTINKSEITKVQLRIKF